MKQFLKITLAVIVGCLITGGIFTFVFFGAVGSLAALGKSQPIMPRSAVLRIDLSAVQLGEQTREMDLLSAVSKDQVSVIGILDALPVFGTGTVLIPWALWSALAGKWSQAAILAGLYVVCYFVRQVLEARMMGGEVGLSSLETLAAVYVGLELFGFWGMILGPLGLLLIEDLTEAWAG